MDQYFIGSIVGNSPTVAARGNLVFYGWVIVVASTIMLMMLAGIVYSFGIFFKRLVVEFSCPRTAISGVLTTYWICHAIFAIPIGWITDRYGPRQVLLVCNLLAAFGLMLMSQASSLKQVYFFYGVMVGCGLAGTFAILSATIARWFVRRRGLALGIAACGIGIGTMMMAPLTESLIAWFDWRGAYLGLGFMTLGTMVLPSVLIYKDPYTLNLLPYGQLEPVSEADKQNLNRAGGHDMGLSIDDVIHLTAYWTILVIFMLFFICMQMTMAHLYNYATDRGIPGPVAATFISVAGGTSIVGRLGISTFSDHFGSRKAMFLCLFLIIMSFCFVVFARRAWMFYTFAVVFGLAYGGEIPLIPGITSHFFGLKSIGFVVGSAMTAVSVGGAVGPLLGGILFDYTNSYTIAFVLLIGLGLGGLVLTLLLPPVGQQ